MQLPRQAVVTLVLGGVRSGKSRYALQIAQETRHVTFVATAEARNDQEMHAKIERHRADRPQHWVTIEEPLKIAQTIRDAGAGADVILVDCLTLFASNLLETCASDPAQLQVHIDQLCATLRTPPCSIILVSNEVGSGVVPAYELGRRFRDLVGEINQRVAAEASTVVCMVAGLPFPLKGTLPVQVRS